MSAASSSAVVRIYTDGGANPNPGPGGWGVVLLDETSGSRRELSGGEPSTTNNRMELTAAICALESLKRTCRVRLFTDSQYLRRGITEWLPSWQRRGWKRKDGEILNLDLWKRLATVAARHEIEWSWVKGHAGDEHNERADELASAAIRRRRRDSTPAADIQIFLKIACARGRGAWAALVHHNGNEEVHHGRRDGVTANQLDLHAAAETLALLPPNVTVAFHTGSDYLRRGASEWLPKWRQRNWKTQEGKAVKNATAWRRLGVELGKRTVHFPHGGDELETALERLGKETKELLKGGGGTTQAS